MYVNGSTVEMSIDGILAKREIQLPLIGLGVQFCYIPRLQLATMLSLSVFGIRVPPGCLNIYSMIGLA